MESGIHVARPGLWLLNSKSYDYDNRDPVFSTPRVVGDGLVSRAQVGLDPACSRGWSGGGGFRPWLLCPLPVPAAWG